MNKSGPTQRKNTEEACQNDMLGTRGLSGLPSAMLFSVFTQTFQDLKFSNVLSILSEKKIQCMLFKPVIHRSYWNITGKF